MIKPRLGSDKIGFTQCSGERQTLCCVLWNWIETVKCFCGLWQSHCTWAPLHRVMLNYIFLYFRHWRMFNHAVTIADILWRGLSLRLCLGVTFYLFIFTGKPLEFCPSTQQEFRMEPKPRNWYVRSASVLGHPYIPSYHWPSYPDSFSWMNIGAAEPFTSATSSFMWFPLRTHLLGQLLHDF